MRAPSSLAVIIVLGGCGEVYTDAGSVRILPGVSDSDCVAEEPEPGPWSPPVLDDTCYLANTPFHVDLVVEGGGDVEAIECDVEQTGEFELTIHTSFRSFASNDGPADEIQIFDCAKTPPLAQGTWTVQYGSGSAELVIPNPEDEFEVWADE
jgi:hypothetical protein